MKVNVTAKHIRKGVPKAPCFCPVALALKERMHKEVEAGPHDLYYLENKKVAGEAVTPDIAAAFMRKFDRGSSVEPFTFEVSFQATRGI